MRRLGRTLLGLLGLVLLLGGAGAAAYVGSDDTVFNRPAELGADGRPVLTAPDLLAWDGMTVTLRAEAPRGVFIGTAHPVDVADWVGDSTRVRLEGVTPEGVVAREAGRGAPEHPEDVGFWTRAMSGAGPQELGLDRSTSAAQWVIAPLGGTGPTTVSFGVTVEGTYAAALAVAGVGLLLLVLAVELLRPRRSRRPRGSRGSRGSRREVPARRGGARRAERPGRRSRATAASLAAVLLATGCTVPELPRPSAKETATLARTKVALTEDDLPQLYASYDRRRARAVRAAGPPAWRDGPWRAADRGLALTVDRWETAARRTMRLGPGPAVRHTGLRVFAARFDSYPMWALVAARPRGGDPEVHVVVRDSVTAPWLVEARTDLTGDLPEAARPGPLPGGRVLDAAVAAREAWGGFLTSGTVADTQDGVRVDEATREWRRAMADLGARAIFRGWEVEARAEDAPVRVVAVAGGHLAVVALRVVTRLRGRPDLAVRWNPPYAALRAADGGVLVVEELAVGLVHLPDEGPPELLGTTFSEEPVGARGSAGRGPDGCRDARRPRPPRCRR